MATGSFPFAPKSTARLGRGQFWALPIEGGEFGAGCVVGKHTRQGRLSRVTFVAGVVRWVGHRPPTPEDLRGLPLERYGLAHILSITTTGGEILGTASIDFEEAPEIVEGTSLPTWGFKVARVVAQRLARDLAERGSDSLSGGERAG